MGEAQMTVILGILGNMVILSQHGKMNHVRPRKRLYAPVGKDCPFSADEIGPQRVTEWKCKGVVSVYKDNWQVHPHQRISSKSWIWATWFFPNKKVDYDHAKV